MPAKVLITGGSGLVGSKLTKMLQNEGYLVSHLSRKPTGKEPVPTFQWNIDKREIDPQALQVDHIIHLAGAGVADKKWTEERKKVIHNSRVESTRLLREELKKNDVKLKSFVCASAIGLYGLDTGPKLLVEDSSAAKDFLAKVVVDWEVEADKFNEVADHVSKVRIGIVLANEGGALPKIKQPIQLGAGALLGSGEQYMSWIHIDDLCSIFSWMLSSQKEGAFNAVAPNPVSNRTMTKAIAKILRKPLLLPPVPAFVLKLMLGEMAGIVLGGNNVSSQKLVDAGFKFQFEQLEPALQDLLK